MSNIVELARNVEKALDAYTRARAVLLSALATESAPGTVSAPRATRARNGKVSVAQQVLARINASPTGATRAEIVGALGHAGAVHSALKKHASLGKIESREGRWVAVIESPSKSSRGKKA